MSKRTSHKTYIHKGYKFHFDKAIKDELLPRACEELYQVKTKEKILLDSKFLDCLDALVEAYHDRSITKKTVEKIVNIILNNMVKKYMFTNKTVNVEVKGVYDHTAAGSARIKVYYLYKVDGSMESVSVNITKSKK